MDYNILYFHSGDERYINDGTEIIFLTLVIYFILNYKYYIHHILSILSIAVLAIIIGV